MSEPPNDIGNVLKRERENRGFSLDMVHEATKIPIDSLKAIEEGYKVRTLTPFYYKSFVRIYAQYLNLDPLPLLSQISSRPAPKKVEPYRPEPVSKKMKETMSLNLFTKPLRSKKSKKALKIVGLVIAAVVVLILVAGLVRKIHWPAPASHTPVLKAEQKSLKKEKALPAATPGLVRKTEEKRKLEPAKPASVVKPVEPVKPPEVAKPVEPVKTPEPAKPAEVVKAVDAVKKPEPPKTTETRVVVKAGQEQKAAAVKPAKKVSATVRALNNAFLIVRADGSTVFQGTLKKGTSDSWNATKTIVISGKDIDQLVFEINGKPIERLGRRGAPVKKIRITPEGLTVEK